METQLIEQCVEQEQELMRQSHRHREELHTLSCLTQIKADEREQKSRDRHRAEVKHIISDHYRTSHHQRSLPFWGQISGLLSANLNVVKIPCNFQRAFTVNTEALPSLSDSFNSGQVGYCSYLIIGLP